MSSHHDFLLLWLLTSTITEDLFTGNARKLAKLMVNFHDPDTIQDLEKKYTEAFEAERFTVDESNPDMMGFLDATEDLGVMGYRDTPYEGMCRLLGIQFDSGSQTCEYPFLNKYLSEGGIVPDDKEAKAVYGQLTPETCRDMGWSLLQPRWHQLVAVAAMMERFKAGRNVILADGVGVGKTLECCMTMAYLRHLRITQTPNSTGKYNSHLSHVVKYSNYRRAGESRYGATRALSYNHEQHAYGAMGDGDQEVPGHEVLEPHEVPQLGGGDAGFLETV